MKVVINRTDAIGDTLLTLPVAYEIKRRYPQADITMLVSQRVAPLLEHNDSVQTVWTWAANYSGLTNFLRLWRLMREKRPDVFIHIGGKMAPLFLAWLLRVKQRLGLLSRWQTFLFLNDGERQSRSMVVMHESQYNINLLAELGISYEDSMLQEWDHKLVQFTSAEREQVDVWLRGIYQQRGWPGNMPFIVIHPGMSGHTLNWPLTHYARFIKRLLTYFPGKLAIFIGFSPADQSTLSTLKNYLSDIPADKQHQIYYFDGSVEGIRHTMLVYQRAAFFVGPSTGPAHMANFAGCKAIYFYSPIKAQAAKRWGPLFRRQDVVVMVPDVICGEVIRCAGQVCPYYECMPHIEVEDAFRHACRFLAQLDIGPIEGSERSTDWQSGDSLEQELSHKEGAS